MEGNCTTFVNCRQQSLFTAGGGLHERGTNRGDGNLSAKKLSGASKFQHKLLEGMEKRSMYRI